MEYFQKGDTIFYQLDASSFTFVEVFNTASQKRVMKISDIDIYNNTFQRIMNSGFVASSEEVFIEKLNSTKSEIQ